MLSFGGIRHACSNYRRSPAFSLKALSPRLHRVRRINAGRGRTLTNRASSLAAGRRSFSTSPSSKSDSTAEPKENSAEDVEKVVRDAKQRFRDTLPSGYLSEQEYALYERLYGPPLRETEPEDVGIPTHADMGAETPQPKDQSTLLRQVDGGELEEVIGAVERQQGKADEAGKDADESSEQSHQRGFVDRAPGYADMVARSQREHDVLQRLVQDFEAAHKSVSDHGDRADAVAEEEVDSDEAADWPPEEDVAHQERELGEHRRFHRYTLDGRFHGSPVEIALPREEFLLPIRGLLERSHMKHVKQAAEAAFGGPGLPTSPSTPEGKRKGNMGGVGLAPDQRHMTEIEADAFLASYLPPAYASISSILREVRKRVGSEWIQSRLKRGGEGEGLSVLDAGGGGAGLVAWEQIVGAEWALLKDKGEVGGPRPAGRKTVIASSDRLRHRLKTFLDKTTFLPRLPDYQHSGEMQGKHLDAGATAQPRKSFDLIIASHLFLKEKQDHYRQAVLNNLWSLLNAEGGVLVVIEKAHPRGFEAVAHVRDTILKRFLLPQAGQPQPRAGSGTEELNPAYHRELEQGHIVAPCSNHGTCPMYKTAGKSKGRKDYCHFNQRFVQPRFYAQVVGKQASKQGEVEFSYVAVRRGVARKSGATGRDATDRAFRGYESSEQAPDMQTLPRLVLPPLKRKGHVTLDLCTAAGDIERWTVPKSFSKLAYHDARKSRWGDLWALGAKSRVWRGVRVGSGSGADVGGDGGQRAAAAAAAAGGGGGGGGEAAADGKKKRPRSKVGAAADEEKALKERRPKTRAAKQRDLMQELLDAEARVEAELDEELDAEAEAAWEEAANVGGGRQSVDEGGVKTQRRGI
ncbi:uncharacterized protein UV8b_02306 [Ustilaginoidea virens]|uniref:37S ribosomal protein Rsm22 n=1 Tax=Ustilaginoidea virens TaxID=1159556 RepID=A0A8E5HM90_USTVR|nr:uncharacterized protein UV8b_02306 [Ustilaginoidea virens]QUC18065.1 hypothetical protein UV8b_02306 [Ustilaginoidea virens]